MHLDFKFFKEKVEEIHCGKLTNLLFSAPKTWIFVATYRPYAYTRFPAFDIRTSALDNQFVYILDGNEAG